MIFRKARVPLLSLLMFFLIAGCQKKNEEGRVEEAKFEEQQGSLMVNEEAGPPTLSIRVPDDAEMQSIFSTEQAIMANPLSDSLRRELGRKAVDNTSRLLWTVGAGRVADPSSAVALSNAERAAWIDGNRWAAYLIEWQKNDYSSPFGNVQTQVPGSVVERKTMNDSMCVALVKTGMP